MKGRLEDPCRGEDGESEDCEHGEYDVSLSDEVDCENDEAGEEEADPRTGSGAGYPEDRDAAHCDRVPMISNIAAEAADLAAIIDDLLVAARSELDLLAVTRVPVAIRGQLAQVIEANSEFAARRVEIVADEEGTLRAIGDPQRVRQILRNLLSNAIEYGGERIQVRLQATDSNVRIQVADDGEGLPPSEWEQIFEPYHRAHAAGTKPASIGIGLSVARQLTQLMSGHLTYRREDNWSIFELRLPAASADAALTDVHRASSSPDLPPTTKTKEPATATTSPNG